MIRSPSAVIQAQQKKTARRAYVENHASRLDPFFVFVPGARGDFIRNILYNTYTAFPDPGKLKIDFYRRPAGIKTHDLLHDELPFPRKFKWPACIDSYLTHWIRVQPHEIESVVWLNIAKNLPDSNINFRRYLRISHFTVAREQHLRASADIYDFIIDFADLWNVDDIQKIVTRITGRTLVDKDKQRIKSNIDLNLDCLKKNIWHGQFSKLEQRRLQKNSWEHIGK